MAVTATFPGPVFFPFMKNALKVMRKIILPVDDDQIFCTPRYDQPIVLLGARCRLSAANRRA